MNAIEAIATVGAAAVTLLNLEVLDEKNSAVIREALEALGPEISGAGQRGPSNA